MCAALCRVTAMCSVHSRVACTPICPAACTQETKLRDLVHKYSEFIHFPIYMWTEKEVDVPVEDEEQEPAQADQGALRSWAVSVQ